MSKRALGLVVVLLVACTSEKDDPKSSTIGPAGGTLNGLDGASIIVPPGAVTEEILVAIAKVTSGFPSGAIGSPLGDVFAFTPHGQTFRSPVTISVPYSSTASEMTLITAQPGGDWSAVPGAMRGEGVMDATVDHFSFFRVVGAQVDAGTMPDQGLADRLLSSGDATRELGAPDISIFSDLAGGLDIGLSADLSPGDAAPDGATCYISFSTACAQGMDITGSGVEVTCEGHIYRVFCVSGSCSCVKDGVTEKSIQTGWTTCDEFDTSVGFGGCGYPFPGSTTNDSGVPDAAPLDLSSSDLSAPDSATCYISFSTNCAQGMDITGSGVEITCEGHIYRVFCVPGSCSCVKDGVTEKSIQTGWTICDEFDTSVGFGDCGYPIP